MERAREDSRPARKARKKRVQDRKQERPAQNHRPLASLTAALLCIDKFQFPIEPSFKQMSALAASKWLNRRVGYFRLAHPGIAFSSFCHVHQSRGFCFEVVVEFVFKCLKFRASRWLTSFWAQPWRVSSFHSLFLICSINIGLQRLFFKAKKQKRDRFLVFYSVRQDGVRK